MMNDTYTIRFVSFLYVCVYDVIRSSIYFIRYLVRLAGVAGLAGCEKFLSPVKF
jgi:hypothetical protein